MKAVPAVHELSASFDIAASACASHGLMLERMPHYGWLVRRAGPGGHQPVIGCIDQVEDGVELMEMDGGFRWTTFRSLLDAVTHLVRVAPEPGRERYFDIRVDQESESPRATADG